MVSQASNIDDDVNIYFVIPTKYKSQEECSEDMWNAFDKCRSYNFNPMWITEEKCNKLTPVKTDVFVIEEFEGELFEKLQSFKCSIVGPMCLLICFLHGEPIPEGKSPIYTTAMRGYCVCVSGLPPPIKAHIQQLVEYMGGYFTKQLRSCVTHLITDSVMSAKYEGATELKIPVFTKDWVEAVWKENLHNFIKADDKMFDKYKCPVFMNLIVTSTSLSKQRKEEIKNLINKNGGIFMGPLDGTKVKVVLAPENSPLTDKLKFAMHNNIACLKPEWVYESIKVGYALPFNNFLIKSTKACSTPEKSKVHETLDCSSISTIACEIPQNNYVDESLATTMINASSVDVTNTGSNKRGSQNTLLPLIDRLSLNEAKMAGPFLDGCNIYLAGFTTNQRDKLNRILNAGGATRLDDISDALTHVIVGDINKASNELKLMKSSGLCPYILNANWIEESMKLKRPASEDRFLYEQKDDTSQKISEPPSPLSKKNLQMLQQPRRPPVPSFNIEKKTKEKDDQDILQQYLQNSDASISSKVSNRTLQELFKPQTSIREEEEKRLETSDQKNISKQNEKSNLTIPSEISRHEDVGYNNTEILSQASEQTGKIFDGLTFVVTGFKDEEILDCITALGGEVVASSFAGIPDYGVVPLCGTTLKHTINEIVTKLFIEDCIHNEQLVDIKYYHKPISVSTQVKPLADCVITMSTYTGTERLYLSTLTEQLGAMCQDILARKTNLEKKTYASTHLICPTPDGNKYKAALKWKLPVVTSDWLISCANSLKKVDETPFLVGEAIAPERPKIMDNTQENSQNANEDQIKQPKSACRQILTPKRHFSQIKSQGATGETPIINKRLSLIMNSTPQSPINPFHISTPDTPYGQIVKPNPSPETRKAWLKWVDNFPDLRVEEPPPKRRPLSTPLSELKRRLWEQLKNQGHNKAEDADMSLTAVGGNLENNLSKEFENLNETKSNTPINKRLNFSYDNNSPQNNQINLQIAQLEEALQRTSSTEGRQSLSGENGKKYENTEPPDQIHRYIAKESQPDTVGWEDPGHRLTSRPSTVYEEPNNDEEENDYENQNGENSTNVGKAVNEFEAETQILPKRKFMLSGIKEREAFEEVIRNLGGEVANDSCFDQTATHLLCVRPSRNEKMLGSIASGKWVLYCLYLRDSEVNGEFLDEEKYEWGNPKSQGIIPEPNGEIEKAVAAAAYKWRLRLLKNPDDLPFCNMVALLLVAEEKYNQFKRLIETGGGTVVQARPPYDTSPSSKRITHCFVNVKQVQQPIDWARLANKGILCFLPQYLSDYLTADLPLNPREHVLPEFKKYLTLMPK